MDKLQINHLTLDSVIGVNSHERDKKQSIIINLEIWTDLDAPAKSDNIHDSVDYKKLYDQIVNLVENSRFYLIEALAYAIAKKCLENKKIKKVFVKVEKPNALRQAKSVSVEIIRKNEK